MFFEIDDAEIKNKILEYNNGYKNKFEAIVEDISTFIYNYPRVIFNVTDDTCSDFYEYILTRLKSILKSYSISKVKFTTWFTVVLRNRYLNFIREKVGNSNQFSDLSFDHVKYNMNGSSVNLHMIIADSRDYDSNMQSYVLNSVIDKIISILNDKYRVLFHLYYIDFLRIEDIRFLSLFFGRNIGEIIEGVDSIKNTIVDKYEKREIILDKLAKNHHSIINYQRLGDEKLENNAREHQDILLNEYRNIKCFPSYEIIASFCDFPVGTVSAGIARIKSKIRGIKDELQKIIENKRP